MRIRFSVSRRNAWWVCCPMAYSTCQVCSLVTQFRENPLVSAHIGPNGDKKIIAMAKSDNTDFFRNFDKTNSQSLFCRSNQLNFNAKLNGLWLIPCLFQLLCRREVFHPQCAEHAEIKWKKLVLKSCALNNKTG